MLRTVPRNAADCLWGTSVCESSKQSNGTTVFDSARRHNNAQVRMFRLRQPLSRLFSRDLVYDGAYATHAQGEKGDCQRWVPLNLLEVLKQ